MNYLQKQMTGTEIEAFSNLPENSLIVKIPDTLYTDFKTVAANENDKELARIKIFSLLKSWLKNQFPGYGILSTVDFSIRDSLPDFKDYKGASLTYGMYVLLLKESETHLITPNKLENGTEIKKDNS